MRRVLPILYIVLPLLFLSGCGWTLEPDRHDVERLLLIQTVGLDKRGTGIEMSVSSGLGPEDSPALVMSATAPGIEEAIARLQNFSPENQLFYAHVQYLLLGTDAARSHLTSVIDWVNRNPTLRMDTNMVIVKDSAKNAVVNASQQSTDITERLASLDRESRSSGWTVYTLREIAAALAEGQGALCLAVQTVPTEGEVFTEEKQGDAVIPIGYAVLGTNGLAGFLSANESMGAELITENAAGILVTVEGNTLEILENTVQIEGIRDPDGSPEGISIQCTLKTGLLEKSPEGGMDPDALDRALSETAATWLAGAVEQAQTLGCDFLGLKDAVLNTQADVETLGPSWEAILSGLSVEISVDGKVDRRYDLAQ